MDLRKKQKNIKYDEECERREEDGWMTAKNKRPKNHLKFSIHNNHGCCGTPLRCYLRHDVYGSRVHAEIFIYATLNGCLPSACIIYNNNRMNTCYVLLLLWANTSYNDDKRATHSKCMMYEMMDFDF